ncbi:Hypothetical protein, putative competence protein [Mycoplasmopsis bovigenitalium 51080]|uniref:ComEC/Rec2-related protein domain-containing protein n=1 Tax=Mycoplasmopsis bovigenitalium 51080 TaxID=1188235 RepID=N9VEV1_9BACT|nr:Hypothetical protein, putative competence protein [Mycoplasmopsis bovigenitalium 51080]
MTAFRIIKRRWPSNSTKITKYINNITNILVILSPLIFHLALTKNLETQYFWIFLYILKCLFIFTFFPKKIILILIIASFYLIKKFIDKPQQIELGHYEMKAYVVKTGEKYAIVNVKNNNFLIYLNKYVTANPLQVGQSVEIKGNIDALENINNFHIANNVTNIINKAVVTRIYSANYSFYNLIENLASRGSELFQKYWKMIVFGQNTHSRDILKKSAQINIVHLLVISGFHIDILFNLLFGLIKKIKNKFTYKLLNIFTNLIIFYYVCTLSSYIPVLRAYLFYIFRKKFNLDSFKSLALCALVTFTINFNNIISESFILSYTATLVTILINKILSIYKLKNTFLKFLIISVAMYIFMIMWSIKFNKQINLVGIIYSFFFALIFEFIYLFSILLWWSPHFLHWIYLALDWLINIANFLSINIIADWQISNKTILIWIIFYNLLLLITLILSKKRKNKKLAV